LPDNQDKAVELGEEPQKKVVIQGVAGSKGFFIKNIPLTVTEEEVRGFLKDYLMYVELACAFIYEVLFGLIWKH